MQQQLDDDGLGKSRCIVAQCRLDFLKYLRGASGSIDPLHFGGNHCFRDPDTKNALKHCFLFQFGAHEHFGHLARHRLLKGLLRTCTMFVIYSLNGNMIGDERW